MSMLMMIGESLGCLYLYDFKMGKKKYHKSGSILLTHRDTFSNGPKQSFAHRLF